MPLFAPLGRPLYVHYADPPEHVVLNDSCTVVDRARDAGCAAMRGVGALADRGFARAAAAGLASVAALAAAGVLIDGARVMMTPARGQPAASTGQRAPFREKLHQTASQTAANSNRNRGAKPAQRSDSGII